MLETEIFWNSIAEYNSGTWIFQIAFVLIAIVLTSMLSFCRRKWMVTAMKLFMIVLCLWLAFVYYMTFAAVRSYFYVMTIFWCMVAAAWAYDLITGYSTFVPDGRYRRTGFLFMLLPLAYPLVSMARGMSAPMIATPVIPSAVALYMLGVLMAFSRKVNFFVFIFIIHWAVIAISKIVLFDLPEDILLAVPCIISMILLFNDAVESSGGSAKPSTRAVKGLFLTVSLVIAACMLVEICLN